MPAFLDRLEPLTLTIEKRVDFLLFLNFSTKILLHVVTFFFGKDTTSPAFVDRLEGPPAVSGGRPSAARHLSPSTLWLHLSTFSPFFCLFLLSFFPNFSLFSFLFSLLISCQQRATCPLLHPGYNCQFFLLFLSFLSLITFSFFSNFSSTSPIHPAYTRQLFVLISFFSSTPCLHLSTFMPFFLSFFQFSFFFSFFSLTP